LSQVGTLAPRPLSPRRSVALALAATLSIGVGAIADVHEIVIVPGGVVMPDGTIVDGKAVVIRDGKIAAIDDADAHAENGDAIRRPGTVLSPGLVDSYSVLGVRGNNVERTSSIDPGLDVIDAVDWWDSGWSAAVAGGITTVMVVPGANNLVGGMTAVIRTGNELRRPEALREHALLMFSLGPPALNPRQAPTSRGGAITMLRSEFSTARAGNGHARLRQLLDDDITALVRADGGEDVTAALRFFETYGVAPTIVHRNELLDVIDDLAESPVPLIVGPYALDTPAHMLAAPARLHRNDIEFAFAGNTPVRDGAAMRLGAALAVRAGLDAATARRGLTINPARILGVDDTVGSIQTGRDADLVLFSRDPLRVDARVLEVWLRGTLVHVAANLHEEILRLEGDADGETDADGAIEDETEE